MEDIKITASFVIPGSVMDCRKDNRGEFTNYETMSVRVRDKHDNYKTVIVRIPKCKPCTQTINMTDAAYSNMLTNPAQGISPKHWVRMPIMERVRAHLKEIQQSLGATDYTFIVYED